MTIRLRETSDGTILPVRVSPGSRAAGIRGVQDGALKVSVTAAPEKGKANKAVVKLLAEVLEIPKSSFEIVSGVASTQKKVLVAGISVDDLGKCLKRVNC